MNFDLAAILFQVSIWALPGIFAITLHEAAHGYAANFFGDDTAYKLGRVSLNPLRHIDPFGTIVLPLILFMAGSFIFGFAKPVPVRFQRLRNPRWHSVIVAAAGPGANIFLALASGWLMHLAVFLPDVAANWFFRNLSNSITINIILAIFNMFPIPPLDGGRVLVGLLPPSLARPVAKIEPIGVFILLFLIFVLPYLAPSLSIFHWILLPIYEIVLQGITVITGI